LFTVAVTVLSAVYCKLRLRLNTHTENCN